MQAADTAMKFPDEVRPIMIPLCTREPPLLDKAPEEISMVKSTLVGAAGTDPLSEQPDKPQRHPGTSHAAAPIPTCDKNSFRFIVLSSTWT